MNVNNESLPPGYAMMQVDTGEWLGLGPNGVSSPIPSSRELTRQWCFAHARVIASMEAIAAIPPLLTVKT